MKIALGYTEKYVLLITSTIFLKQLYIGDSSKLIEKKIIDITSRTYFSVKARVLFVSKKIFHN